LAGKRPDTVWGPIYGPRAVPTRRANARTPFGVQFMDPHAVPTRRANAGHRLGSNLWTPRSSNAAGKRRTPFGVQFMDPAQFQRGGQTPDTVWGPIYGPRFALNIANRHEPLFAFLHACTGKQFPSRRYRRRCGTGCPFQIEEYQEREQDGGLAARPEHD